MDEVGGELANDNKPWVKAEFYPGERLLWNDSASARATSEGLVRPIPTTIFLFLMAASVVSFGTIARFPVEATLGYFFLGFMAVIVDFFLLMTAISRWKLHRVKDRKLKDTCYALTDRRIIVVRPGDIGGGMEIFSIKLKHIRNLYRIETDNGSGDLVFRISNKRQLRDLQPIAFQSIKNVRQVETMIRELVPALGLSDSAV